MHFNKTKYPTKTIIKWLWRHNKECRKQALLNVTIGIIQVILGLIGVEVLRQLTDIAAGKTNGPLMMMGGFYILIIISEFICNIAHTWIAAVLGVKTQNLMQQQFFNQLLKSKWQGIEKFHSGDILNRLFGDVNDIVNLMTEVLPFIVTLLIQFIASFIYLLNMDAYLAYILIIASPFFLLLSKLYFRKMRRIVRKIKDSNSTIQSIIQESIQHKMVIKVMEIADTMIEKLDKHQSLLRWQIKYRAQFSILTRTLVFIGFRGGALIALIFSLYQLNEGLITVGVLMAFTQLIGRIQHPLLEFSRLLPTFVNSFTSSERLMELEELPVEEKELQQTDIDLEDSSSKFGIRFNNISYRYNDKKYDILSNFNYEFKPGTFTAVLGETGAGKTTMLRLMLALIEPNEGNITIFKENCTQALNSDDVNDNKEIIAGVNTRKLFSYVPQGNTLFSGTIRDNLRIGNPQATTSQMYEALNIAQADFVKDLPDKLDTLCGEGGGGLSEGQAQRIAIARALLRPFKILLLDEATSALDIQTEEILLTNLKQKYTDRTIIFITHRLSTVSFTSQQITLTRNKRF